jgi:hypothetical protein
MAVQVKGIRRAVRARNVAPARTSRNGARPVTTTRSSTASASRRPQPGTASRPSGRPAKRTGASVARPAARKPGGVGGKTAAGRPSVARSPSTARKPAANRSTTSARRPTPARRGGSARPSVRLPSRRRPSGNGSLGSPSRAVGRVGGVSATNGRHPETSQSRRPGVADRKVATRPTGRSAARSNGRSGGARVAPTAVGNGARPSVARPTGPGPTVVPAPKQARRPKELIPPPEAQPDQCVHQWVIEPPNGPTSQGKCRLCGEVRAFRNSLDITYWDTQRHGAGAAQRRKPVGAATALGPSAPSPVGALTPGRPPASSRTATPLRTPAPALRPSVPARTQAPSTRTPATSRRTPVGARR